MGTRNSTIVKLNGKVVVEQYGQWDGYPTGQGQVIADFLKTVNLNDFKSKLSELKEITEEQTKEVNKDPKWTQNYPYLSRDAGAGVLQMIAEGGVKFISLDRDFKNDTTFCEYWYEIDLDKKTVTIGGWIKEQVFTFDEWTRDGLMEELESNNNE